MDRRDFIAAGAGVGISLLLDGCGGGSGRFTSPNPDPTVLYTRTAIIGPSGGVLVVPEPFNVSLTISPDSVAADTAFTVTVRKEGYLQTPNSALVATSKTVTLATDGAVTDDARLTLRIPYIGEADTENDFGVLKLENGTLLPVTTTFDTTSHTSDLVSTGKYLNFDPSTSRSHGRSNGKSWVWSLIHPNQRLTEGEAYFKRFAWAGSNLPHIEGDNIDDPWLPFDNVPDRYRDWREKRVAILIHGIRNDIRNLNHLAYYLATLKGSDGKLVYEEVWGVDYKWRDDIGSNGERVAEFIYSRPQDSNTQIHIFAHSMGGLVARWAIERAEIKDGPIGCGGQIERLYTFNTPHNGVPVEGVRCILLSPAFVVLNAPLAFAQGINDLGRGGRFLRLLNQDPSPYRKSVAYYTFAGNHWAGYRIGIGATVHLVYTGDDNNMDGIVPVNSAQWLGLADKSDSWTHPSETYKLNHDQSCGVYDFSGKFDLDNDASLRPYTDADQIEPQYQRPPNPRFKDYVLGTAIGTIDIK